MSTPAPEIVETRTEPASPTQHCFCDHCSDAGKPGEVALCGSVATETANAIKGRPSRPCVVCLDVEMLPCARCGGSAWGPS